MLVVLLEPLQERLGIAAESGLQCGFQNLLLLRINPLEREREGEGEGERERGRGRGRG